MSEIMNATSQVSRVVCAGSQTQIQMYVEASS
jgi:hypothetical protein